MWNENSDVLAAVSDSKLLVWNCPNAAFVDRDLVNLTRSATDARYHLSITYVLPISLYSPISINGVSHIVILVRMLNL
jgi:hypothetical protein